MATFHHFGVPTDVKQENEIYIEGAKVFITDLSQEKLDECRNEFVESGYSCEALAADVTNYDQTKAVVEKTLECFGGKIDILVNVAGAVAQGRVEDITDKDWDLMFDVNCKGTFYFIKQVPSYGSQVDP